MDDVRSALRHDRNQVNVVGLDSNLLQAKRARVRIAVIQEHKLLFIFATELSNLNLNISTFSRKKYKTFQK